MNETSIIPRALRAEDAARYLGMKPSLFRTSVASEVKPVYISSRRPVWLREQLDAWLDQKAGIERHDHHAMTKESNPLDALI